VWGLGVSFGLGLNGYGSGFRIFQVLGFGARVQICRVEGSEVRVEGLELGFRV
jgi:hypothetical protein